MASTTPNLKLKLLGTSLADKETYFEEWRQDISGETGSSNMQLIDKAVGDIAEDIDNMKTSDVTDVEYDQNTNKLKKTVNGQARDVFDAVDLPVSDATRTALNEKANKADAVTMVEYDPSSKKIRKTINGTASDIVSVDDIAGAMDTISDAQIEALFE